jgi:hypothetical protein
LTARLLTVLVLAGPAVAPGGAAAAERVHAGTTSADDPIVLVQEGREVTRLAMQISARCAGGGDRVALLIDAPTGVAVRRGGRFAAEQRLDAPLASGRTARGRLSIEGRVTGRRVTGTVRYRAKLLDAAGTATDRCRQRFTFKARSGRGTRFGGSTSQRAPMTLGVRGRTVVDGATIRLRRTVRTFGIGWRATWSDGGTVQVGDTLRVRVEVRDGRFAATWTDERGRDTIAYSLAGTIRGGRVTGTFRARVTRAGTAGVAATADTGQVTFSARSR